MKTSAILERLKEQGFDVKVETKYLGQTFTIAQAELYTTWGPERKFVLSSEGISRRSETQVRDLQIGEAIAHNRALEACLKKIRRKRHAVHHWAMG